MTQAFSKSGECPSSYAINAFELGECEPAEGTAVRLHLRGCEFCAAEAAFYARFPQPLESLEDVPSPEIPEPLRELAESILGTRDANTGELEKLYVSERKS